MWRDDPTSWIPVVEVKDSNPIELAEYATLVGVEIEPAFRWWVPHALRCRRRMIAKAKSRDWRMTHKFGIKVPRSVEEACAIDTETGTDFWHKAIEKEMKRILTVLGRVDIMLESQYFHHTLSLPVKAISRRRIAFLLICESTRTMR